MALVWRNWLLAIYLFSLIVGCSSQTNQETFFDNSTESSEAVKTLAVTRDELQLSLEPTKVGREPVGTVIPSTPPLRTPEQKMDTENREANADVLFVKARQESADTWNFSVTIEHPDTGWEDYADGWDVVLPDGSVVKPDATSPFTRLLLHPHETEQPFTRSQGDIVIEPGITKVTVRAHDLVDGFGGREVVVDLMSSGGLDFEVQPLSE
jgi:hypothetical protein